MTRRMLETALVIVVLVAVPLGVFVLSGSGRAVNPIGQARSMMLAAGIRPGVCTRRSVGEVTCTIASPDCVSGNGACLVFVATRTAAGGAVRCAEPSPILGYGTPTPPSCTVRVAAGL